MLQKTRQTVQRYSSNHPVWKKPILSHGFRSFANPIAHNAYDRSDLSFHGSAVGESHAAHLCCTAPVPWPRADYRHSGAYAVQARPQHNHIADVS